MHATHGGAPVRWVVEAESEDLELSSRWSMP